VTVLKLLPLFASLAALTSASVYALGIRIPDQNAHATARGDAFAATADNPSAVYYNPAGLTQLSGTRALLGAYSIALEAEVDPDFGASVDTKNELQAAPQFFLSHQVPNRPVVFGLGVFSPFGFGLEYPNDAPFRTLATKGRIQFISISAVVAWKITDTLSLGAGPAVNYGRVKLARGIGITAGDEFIFEGEGVGYGFSAGVMWTPHRMHSFGATYRSATTIDFSGHSRVRIPAFTVETPFGPFPFDRLEAEEDANFEYDFPQTVTVGYSFRPTADWNLEFNLDWTDWDSLNTLTLRQGSGDIALPFNWESSFLYEFGVTRQLPRGFSASAGYVYSENSIPNESFNPLIPDSNRHIFSLGIGQKLEQLSWDIAYQYAYGPERHIDNGTLANGHYRFESHAVSLTFGYHF
jgi:long-chain fatty acid transport protein